MLSVDTFKKRFPELATRCDKEVIGEMLDAFVIKKNIRAGEILIKQDQSSDMLFLVYDGLLSVEVEVDGENIPLGIVDPGQWVGEISIIEPGPATATVKILEPATLLCLRNSDLEALGMLSARAVSSLLHALSDQMVERLRNSSMQAFGENEDESENASLLHKRTKGNEWVSNFSRWALGIRTNMIEVRATKLLDDKQIELDLHYKHLFKIKKEQILKNERERILAELHDGVGGQLVAMLAILEKGEQETSTIKDSVKLALDDLRLMIDSLDLTEGDLPVVLGMFRSRVELRIKAQGIRFDWQVIDLPEIKNMGPAHVLQILRILQEAITNIIKHSGADVISVSTGVMHNEQNRAIVISLKDNGHGISKVENARTGYGMSTMRKRASELGGSLRVDSGADGTTVRLFLPEVMK